MSTVDGAQTLLVDTSTLLRVDLDRFSDELTRDDGLANATSAIESLILFPEVLLDGPSVERNEDRLLWLRDIGDGIRQVTLDEAEEVAIYEAGVSLAGQVRGKDGDVDFYRMHMPKRLGAELRPHGFAPSTTWADLKRLTHPGLSRVLEELSKAFGSNQPYSGAGFVALARLFYYLALQSDSSADALLLDRTKSYLHEVPSYATSRRILDVFDARVRVALRDRQTEWLGRSDVSLALPLLTNYALAVAHDHGWSLGRAIAWLRESREVHLFREGITELMRRVESGDIVGMDEVLAELEAASIAWSSRVGAPLKKRVLPITVPIPIMQPTFNIPLPNWPPVSPGSRMLVLIDRALAANPNE